ncbi:MAG: M6 family metalloprotease domain-containing protein [Ruminococcaceae bacterium]|nr:M6 family metalloprotease domain-containing protein [Oscillospiraceae bacterium]
MKDIFKKGLLSMLCVGAVLYSTVVFAGPAKPELFEHTQPDGGVITARLWGDEFYNFIGDEEGYLLTETDDGALAYVTENDANELVVASPSKSGRPADAVKGFDLRPDIPAHFGIEEEQDEEEEIEEPAIMFAASAQEGTMREQKLLIVVPDYNDFQMKTDIWTADVFNRTFFSQSSDVYSVANYYKEVSGDRVTFVPAFTSSDIDSTAKGTNAIIDADLTDTYGVYTNGVIRVKLDKNHIDKSNISTGESNAEAKKILTELDQYVDFSVLSGGKATMSNSDFSILLLLPGYEKSGTSSSPGVWAHKTWLSSGYATTLDGVKLCTSGSGYLMVGSLDVNSSKNTPSKAGVFCHELGHLVFGLPDLYATDGGTDYSGLESLSLMNAGSWGAYTGYIGGTHPAHLDAWCKYHLGWYDEEDLLEVDESHVGEYELVNWLSDKDGYKMIKINSTKDDEYYLLENRRFLSFDKGIRYKFTATGVAAYRIDKKRTTSAYISGNNINNGSDPGVKVMHSGKGLTDFYTSTKPMWYTGNNRITSFGKATFPNNVLNTPVYYTDPIDEKEYLIAEDSGVGFSVHSPSQEVMKVKLGMNDVDSQVYTSSGSTKMYLFNNTDGPISTVPFLAEYNGNSMNNLLKYDRITVDGKGYGATSDQTLTVDTATYKYKNFTLDFPKFTPYFTDYVPPVPQEKVYRLAVDADNDARDGAYDGMRVKEGSYVLFNVLNGYTYLNNGYLAESTTAPKKLVALKIGRGTNKFTAANDKETLDGDTIIGIPTGGTKNAVTSDYLTDVTATSGIADTDHATIYNVNTGASMIVDASTAFTTGGADYIKFSGDVYYTLSNKKINGSTGYCAIFAVEGSSKKYISIFDDGSIGVGASGTYAKTGIILSPDTWHHVEICSDSTGKSLDVYINGVLAIKGYTGAGTFTKGFKVHTGLVNSQIYYSNLNYTLHIPGTDDEEEDTGMKFALNTTGGLANMTSGENAVVGSKVEFSKPRISQGNTVKYFNNGIDITDTVEEGNGIVSITVANKGDNKIKAVNYNGNEVVEESEEINVVGITVTGSGTNGGTDTIWPPDTKYAAYLEEGAEATEEEIAIAKKLWGVVDGVATRKPARGTGTATAGYSVNLETSDYLYLRTNIFINDELASDTPWFSRWEGNYIRINGNNNRILINTATDTGVTVQANEWQKIEIYADGTNMDIYINGVLKGKKCAPLSMTSVRMWLGSSSADAEPNLYIDRLDYLRGNRNIEQ